MDISHIMCYNKGTINRGNTKWEEMKMKLYLDGRRNGYSPKQCGRTMTVGELINWLEQFDEDAEVFIRNDNGYTYGNINEQSFEEDYDDDDED